MHVAKAASYSGDKPVEALLGEFRRGQLNCRLGAYVTGGVLVILENIFQSATIFVEKFGGGSAFSHSHDYRSICLRGKSYALTVQIAQIVQYLHEHAENGTPDVGQDNVLEHIESGNKRLRDCFPGIYRQLWKELIASNKKGTVRLNL